MDNNSQTNEANAPVASPIPVAPQTSIPQNPPAPGLPLTPPTPEIKKPSKLRFLFVIILAVFAILLIALFVFSGLNKKKTPSAPSPTTTPPEAQETIAPRDVWTSYTNKKYFYSIDIPPRYLKQDIGSQIAEAEEYVEFVKTEGENVSKIRILMTSSDTQRNEIASLKDKLKNVRMTETLKSDSFIYSKIFVSNLTAYKTLVDENNYSVKLLVEKDKWIYQFNFETNVADEKAIFTDVETKLKIYDSAAEFFIDHPQS